MIPEYTTVLGVDHKHLQQLGMVWQTWKRHKPSLLKHPLVVFYDKDSCRAYDVRNTIDHPDITVVMWPPLGDNEYVFPGAGVDKWSNPQRHKMLAGFVHIPRMWVKTPYWLKVDLDVVAAGMDDWIDPEWFADSPAIVAPSWKYTKPADQMLKLDAWAAGLNGSNPFTVGPLNLVPAVGSDKVVHERICSWCAFFRTDFTCECSNLCLGEYSLPVPSQDGFQWYVAKRLNEKIVYISPKRLGWVLSSTKANIQRAIADAMK